MEITDLLPLGSYHLKFFVTDVAGNESCVESFVIPAENTGCTADEFNPVFLIVRPSPTE